MARKPLKDLVVYHNGHFLRGKNPRTHADRLRRFLIECTCAVVQGDLAVQVRTGPGYDAEKSKALIKTFTAKWGPAGSPPKGLKHLGAQFPHSWTPDLSVEEMLDVVTSHAGPGQMPLPMLSVSVKCAFQLKDPASNKPLPNQNWDLKAYQDDPFFRPHGYSEIWCDLGESSTIGALISFPFPADDPQLASYLEFFQAGFPATLSTKSSNWHWWVVSKDGTKHYRKSVVSAFRARLASTDRHRDPS